MLSKAEAIQYYPMMAGDFRHFTPALNEHDAVIGISASGEFRDVLAVFERWNAQVLCVGITQVPGSSITRLANHTLLAGGGQSRVSVMTKTYASTLTAAHLLVLAATQAPDEILQDLQACAAICEEGIQAAELAIPEILPQVAGFEHAFHFGAGPAYAACLESALKMKEMAILHAEGAETWEMASGSAIILDERALCVALYSGGAGDSSTAETARHARRWGARVLEIGPQAVCGRHAHPGDDSEVRYIFFPVPGAPPRPAGIPAGQTARVQPRPARMERALHRPGHEPRHGARKGVSPTRPALGIDIGGTHTKLGVVDASGSVLVQQLLQTAARGDAHQFLEELRRRVSQLIDQFNPRGIGFSIPGLLSENRQVIEYNPNTPALVGTDFFQEFKSFGLPLAFETDLNTPALAEYYFSEIGRNTRLLAAVIGTGLGAAVILDGHLLRIFGGVAGDNGHIILQPGGEACTAGCRGCAEALVSVAAIERIYQRSAYSPDADEVREAISQGMPIARAVIQAAAAGDGFAGRIMAEIGSWLGAWLASLSAMFMPQVMILCGGVAEAGESLRAPAEQAFRQLAGAAYTKRCEVVTGRFCGQAGMIGAVVPLFQEAGNAE